MNRKGVDLDKREGTGKTRGREKRSQNILYEKNLFSIKEKEDDKMALSLRRLKYFVLSKALRLKDYGDFESSRRCG